jgi:hypothetical protein
MQLATTWPHTFHSLTDVLTVTSESAMQTHKSMSNLCRIRPSIHVGCNRSVFARVPINKFVFVVNIAQALPRLLAGDLAANGARHRLQVVHGLPDLTLLLSGDGGSYPQSTFVSYPAAPLINRSGQQTLEPFTTLLQPGTGS